MDEKALQEFALQELMLWAAFNTYYDLAVLLWQQSGSVSYIACTADGPFMVVLVQLTLLLTAS